MDRGSGALLRHAREWHTVGSQVLNREVLPKVQTARRALVKLWALRVLPLFARADAVVAERLGAGWPDVRRRAARRLDESQAALSSGARAALARLLRLQASAAGSAQALAAARLPPGLTRYATPAAASLAVWACLAAAALPLMAAGLGAALALLAHFLRPARVVFMPPAELEPLQHALRYDFRAPGRLVAGLRELDEAGAVGGAPTRLESLGRAAALLIEKERDVNRNGPEPRRPGADSWLPPPALRAMVRPGRGRKSLRAVPAALVRAWHVVLGAVLLDAGGELGPLRRMLAGASNGENPRPASVEAPPLDEEPHQLDDELHSLGEESQSSDSDSQRTSTPKP